MVKCQTYSQISRIDVSVKRPGRIARECRRVVLQVAMMTRSFLTLLLFVVNLLFGFAEAGELVMRVTGALGITTTYRSPVVVSSPPCYQERSKYNGEPSSHMPCIRLGLLAAARPPTIGTYDHLSCCGQNGGYSAYTACTVVADWHAGLVMNRRG